MKASNETGQVEAIRMGSITIDPERRSIERNGQALEVEPRVFDLLVHLARRAGRVCSKNDLLDAVWGDRVVSESTLYRAVRLARAVLDSEPDHRIRTVHARGYELIGPVSMLAPPSPVSHDDRDARGTDASPRVKRRVLRIAAAVLVVLLLTVAAMMLPRGERSDGNGERHLVLSIGGLEARAEDSEFPADGLWSELESELARVDGLRLRRSAGAGSARGDRLLRGSWTRQDSGALQLHVELLDARSERLVWSANFERPANDADELRRDVSTALIEALGLSPRNPAGESLPLPAGMASSRFSDYLRARELWRQRSAASLSNARTLLEDVLLEHPDFSRAHEALASVYLVLPDWSDLPPVETRRLAGSAAREALRLEPRLGEARAVLAQLALADRRWREAETLFDEALKRESGNPTIRHWYAEFLLRTGRLERASAQAREAHALDPLAAMPANVAAWAELIRGRNDDADRYAARAVANGLDAAALIRAWAHARLGKRPIRNWLERLPQPTDYLPACGEAATVRSEREAIARRIELSSRDDELARVYALACLALAGAAGTDHPERLPPVDSSAFALLWTAEYRPVRRRPDFLTRLEEAGLIDYWSETGPPDRCRLPGSRLVCD